MACPLDLFKVAHIFACHIDIRNVTIWIRRSWMRRSSDINFNKSSSKEPRQRVRWSIGIWFDRQWRFDTQPRGTKTDATGALWRSQRGAGGHDPQSRKYIMVGNGEPITGCLIHRVTRYKEFQDTAVRISFPVLPFRKIIVIIQIGFN